MQNTISDAYSLMGTTDRVAITHGSCFPAMNYETFVGSPFSNASKKYINFLAQYGFNGNQLGPNGDLQKNNISPYNSSALTENRLFIDLEVLSTDSFANILSKNDLSRLMDKPEKDNKNYVYSDFEKANELYDKAILKSYKNLVSQAGLGRAKAIDFYKEFSAYLKANNDEKMNSTQEEAVFKMLSNKYGTDDFSKWDNELDENLLVLVKDGDEDAKSRYRKLTQEYRKEINLHQFEQFILDKQIKENKEFREVIGFKYISDLLVGCSKMDYWRNKDAFVEGYQLGAAGGDTAVQAWGVPVLNPRKMFVGEDELGVAGEFLKNKINHALEYCENIRIDHVMGLIEPFVVENASLVYDEKGNIINDENNPVNATYMSKMKSKNGEPLDDYKNYSSDFINNDGSVSYFSKVMNKIVLPTLKEHGLENSDPIWEDICSQPEAFNKVYYENLHLPSLDQLEWSKVEGKSDKNWSLVGSHDSIPAMNMVKRDWTRNSEFWNPLYLAGYLHKDGDRISEGKAFCEKIDSDDKELVKAKFSELMTAKKFQISFADILGIVDKEVVYNVGGVARDANWKLRISPDFEQKYYENLASEEPTALNIPEVLKVALHAKLDELKNMTNNDDFELNKLDAQFMPIINELAHYEAILKE
ncbi:MAG: 4-alpha-glucanotransferase [Candidatus Gastranaerophilales bacterium]